MLILTSMAVISVFVIVLLLDISINLRRMDGNIKKMISKYDMVHGSNKA
jgi:hypothetical protein